MEVAIGRDIKGITIEIDGDTTKLQSAIKQVNSEIKTTQSQLKDLDKLLKLDPGNIDLLKQKYNALGSELETTKKKLETLKEAQKQMQEAGKTDTSEYQALQREIAETETKVKSLTKEMKEFGSVSAQAVTAAGEKVKDVGEKVSSTGDKLTKSVTVPIVALGTAAVKTAADFDSQMSKVSAISGATGDDLEDLRDKAIEMGDKTKFSATEAGQAYEYMAMAGWKTGEMLDGVDGIMNLAAASGEDLATTSDIVTDALTAFGLKASDSAHFADILAAASSNSNTNVSMMGETFKYVAPLAGSLGYSAEDTALAIGVMANAGIKGSQAGTSLRNIISRIAKPTGEVSDAMRTLGVSLTDSNGKVRPLREVLDELRESFNHGNLSQVEFTERMNTLNRMLEDGELTVSSYTQEQQALSEKLSEGIITQAEYAQGMYDLDNQLAMGLISDTGSYEAAVNDLMIAMYGAEGAQTAQIASTIAGKNAMSGFLAIMNATEEDWNKLSTSIDGCDGSAQAMADTMQDNLEGQLTILQSNLQTLAISVGELIMPVIRDVVSIIQDVVGWLNSLDEGTKSTIVQAAALVAAIGPVLSIGGRLIEGIGTMMTWAPKIVSAVTGISGLFSQLWGVLAANPIALVIAAVAALVAGFVYLWNTSEEFRQFWITLWEAVKSAAETVVNAIVEFFTSTLPDAFNAISETFSSVWEGIAAFFAGVWEGIQQTFNDAVSAIGSAVSDAWNTIQSVTTSIFEAVSSAVSTAWETIRSTVETVVSSVSSAVSSAWETVQSVSSSVFSAVANAVSTAWNTISQTVTSVVESVKSAVSTAWQSVQQTTSSVFETVRNAVSTAWQTISTTVSTAVNNVKTAISTGFESAKSTLSNILESIKTTVSNVFGGVWDFIQGVVEKLKNVFNFHWELPKIKLPHFSISGSFSLNPLSVPHLSVEWYKKAMDDGMILNSPTIFGAAGGKLLGGGEAGPEAVVGVDSLRSMIIEAVSQVASLSGGGNITVPVYIGQEKLDTIIAKSTSRATYRSGGR